MTTETTMTKVFKVLASRFSDFQSKIEKLNRKATKVGASLVSFTASEMIQKVTVDEQTGKKMVHEYHNVTVTGSSPKFDGWQFLGTIEHTPAGNILRSVPGMTIPETFRATSTVCDHCKTKRNRKDTFVVLHDSGEIKQIGRQCIRDFLGHQSPEMIAQQCEFYASFGSMNEDDFFGGSAGKEVEDTMVVLAMAVAVARRFGFVSKAASTESTASTASIVSYNLYPPTWSAVAMTEWKASVRRVECTTDDAQYAETIRQWIIGLDTTASQFLGNLKVALSNQYCQPRDFGIICAGYTAHNRDVGDPRVKAKADIVAFKDEHFGVVGKRDIFELTVVEARNYETQYGVGTILKFRDQDGREAVWFSSKGAGDMEVGQSVKVKATVKAHGDYKGKAQTILSRAVAA